MQPLGHSHGLPLIGDDDIDDPVARLDVDRPDGVRVDVAQAAAGNHRRAAHPDRHVLGGDDQIRAAGDHRVAGEAAAGDDRDPWNQARQARPQGERPRVERRDDGVVRVPGPPPAALGEEHGRQPHSLDQLEQAVLLAVTERALRPGENRVVIGEDRARAPIAELITVDPGRPANEAVRRRALDQLLEIAARALCGDRETPVLDERTGVDEVDDVLTRGPAAAGVAPFDGLRSSPVLGQRSALEKLGQIRLLGGRFVPLHQLD